MSRYNGLCKVAVFSLAACCFYTAPVCADSSKLIARGGEGRGYGGEGRGYENRGQEQLPDQGRGAAYERGLNQGENQGENQGGGYAVPMDPDPYYDNGGQAPSGYPAPNGP